MSHVARIGTEEPLTAFEQTGVMLVSAHTAASPEGFGDLRLVFDDRRNHVESTRQILRREQEGLLRRKRIRLVNRVIGDIAARGLSHSRTYRSSMRVRAAN
jgi:hypothetical protein